MVGLDDHQGPQDFRKCNGLLLSLPSAIKAAVGRRWT